MTWIWGDKKITDDDLPLIEKEMKKIAKDGKRIVREEISKRKRWRCSRTMSTSWI